MVIFGLGGQDMNKQSPPTQPGLQEPVSRQALKLLKHCLEKQHRKGDSVKTTHKSFIYNLTEQVIVTLLRCSHAGVGEASPKTPTDANSHHLEVICKLGPEKVLPWENTWHQGQGGG